MNNEACCGKEAATPMEVTDFERIYQKLSTSISDIDYLTSEIMGLVSKFKTFNLDEKQELLDKEPNGLIETFEVRVNYMKKIIKRLEETHSALRKIV